MWASVTYLERVAPSRAEGPFAEAEYCVAEAAAAGESEAAAEAADAEDSTGSGRPRRCYAPDGSNAALGRRAQQSQPSKRQWK